MSDEKSDLEKMWEEDKIYKKKLMNSLRYVAMVGIVLVIIGIITKIISVTNGTIISLILALFIPHRKDNNNE